MKKKEMTQKEFARMGAIAKNGSLTPEQRKAVARHAINTRWERYRAAKTKKK